MPDGTEAVAGATTSPKPTGTSTYTEEQVKERERKARSDALAEAGRYKATAEKASKEAETASKEAKFALDELRRMQQERIVADLEAHKDEPAYIRAIRAEEEARQAKADLANREQEVNEEREKRIKLEAEHTELSKAETARDIAQSLNVDATRLVKLAKFTDGSREAIEDIAKDLPKLTPQGDGKPDSNQSRGGGSGKTPTVAELQASSPEETEKKVKSGEWVIAGWR